MGYLIEYGRWYANPDMDETSRRELEAIRNNPAEIEARFNSTLAAGAAGITAKGGIGLCRLNIYTVRQISQVVSGIVLRKGEDADLRGIAVFHDCRGMSAVYAEEAARVFAASGIKVYIAHGDTGSPFLSFTVHEFNCAAGVYISAGSDPDEYGAYSLFDGAGSPLPAPYADMINREINEMDVFEDVRESDFDASVRRDIITAVGKDTGSSFLSRVASGVKPFLPPEGEKSVRIGVSSSGGNIKAVQNVLLQSGFKKVALIDGNPSSPDSDGMAPTAAAGQAQPESPKPDIIFFTDAGTSRVAVTEYACGGCRRFSGNETGALLTDYMISLLSEKGSLPENAAVIKSASATPLISKICRDHGVSSIEVPPGFANISAAARDLHENRRGHFIFGFEENGGFLFGDYLRDRDAAGACAAIAGMTQYHMRHKTTLEEALTGICRKYGYYAAESAVIRKDVLNTSLEAGNIMRKLGKSCANGFNDVGVSAVVYCPCAAGENWRRETVPPGPEIIGAVIFELDDGGTVVVYRSSPEHMLMAKMYSYDLTAARAKDKIKSYSKCICESLQKNAY